MEHTPPEAKALECLSTHLAFQLQEGAQEVAEVPIPKDSSLKKALVEHNIVAESKESLDAQGQNEACLVLGEFVQAANQYASKDANSKKKNSSKPRRV